MDDFEQLALYVSRIPKARDTVDGLREKAARDTLSAANDVDRACKQFARSWFSTETVWPAVRELVDGVGYVVKRPPGLLWPTLGGANASTAAAGVNGASWGTSPAGIYNARLREREYLFGAPRVEERRTRRREKFPFTKGIDGG